MDENSYSKGLSDEQAKRLLEEGRKLFPPEPRVVLPIQPEPRVPFLQRLRNSKSSILRWVIILVIGAGGLWVLFELFWRLFVAFGLVAVAACPC